MLRELSLELYHFFFGMPLRDMVGELILLGREPLQAVSCGFYAKGKLDVRGNVHRCEVVSCFKASGPGTLAYTGRSKHLLSASEGAPIDTKASTVCS